MTKVGYARCSTDKQELTAQRQALCALGVSQDRIYTYHGRPRSQGQPSTEPCSVQEQTQRLEYYSSASGIRPLHAHGPYWAIVILSGCWDVPKLAAQPCGGFSQRPRRDNDLIPAAELP